MPVAHYYPFRAHITDHGVVSLITTSCYVGSILISVSDPGQNWGITIKDKSDPPMTLVPPAIISVISKQAEFIWTLDLTQMHVYMEGGVIITTGGGNPGVIDVWIMASKIPNQ